VDELSAARALRDAFAALPAGSVAAVIGGGMTGLEAVTELAEARPDVQLKLISAGAPGGWLSDAGRTYLAGALARMDIEVIEAAVTGVEPDRVLTAAGEVACDLAVWCGGFVPRPLAREAGMAVDERGCVRVDAALRSLSHPHVLAAGDAAATGYRMACGTAIPVGAHAADTLAAELAGREPEPFGLGYVHQPISLGRRDALIQWVDRADVPKESVLTGRRAAVYKNTVTGLAPIAMRLERRFPGATVWLGPAKAAPAAEPVAA
jgi:NADH dehydrogenase FAD-containing subunit